MVIGEFREYLMIAQFRQLHEDATNRFTRDPSNSCLPLFIALAEFFQWQIQ